MLDSLIIEPDQIFFRTSLTQAQVLIHGRNSFEGGLDVPGRHRDRDSKVDAITAISATPQILRWNPLGSRDGAWGEGQRLRRSDGSIR
jgi:hypothetical protein